MQLFGGYIVLFRMSGCYAILPSIAIVTRSPIHKVVLQCEWMGLVAIFNFGWRYKMVSESLFAEAMKQ
jgi:hypothetical protein